MITEAAFYRGRDLAYAAELTTEIRECADMTMARVSDFLELAGFHNPVVNSGWRPKAVNANTRGAAPKSKHMLGQAIDIADDDGALGVYVLSESGRALLETRQLWCEHPATTPRWVHFQTVPPRSGNRIFLP
jgi:hypothetical protein